jgi:hypothetical protein
LTLAVPSRPPGLRVVLLELANTDRAHRADATMGSRATLVRSAHEEARENGRPQPWSTLLHRLQNLSTDGG